MEFNKILILAVIVIVGFSAYPGSAAPSIATFQEVAEVNKEAVQQMKPAAAAPVDVNTSNLKARAGRFYPYYPQPYGGGYGGGSAAASASASASSVGGGYGRIYG